MDEEMLAGLFESYKDVESPEAGAIRVERKSD